MIINARSPIFTGMRDNSVLLGILGLQC